MPRCAREDLTKGNAAYRTREKVLTDKRENLLTILMERMLTEGKEKVLTLRGKKCLTFASKYVLKVFEDNADTLSSLFNAG
jgi:hypothetical protein